MIPREGFSRYSNAELVSRALLNLDVPAYVNERHDICVDGFKVSGSAYKMVNKRAYHHGTMLIDTDVEVLRSCLKSGKDKMLTKGVESVPSPVTNLRNYSYTIDHQYFCEAVIDEFVDNYNEGFAIQPYVITENNLQDLPKTVRDVKQELRTWNWIFGQTPEFTNEISTSFSWGDVMLHIRSKHGVILEANAEINSDIEDMRILITGIGVALEGANYSVEGIQDAIVKLGVELPGILRDGKEARELVDWMIEQF